MTLFFFHLRGFTYSNSLYFLHCATISPSGFTAIHTIGKRKK